MSSELPKINLNKPVWKLFPEKKRRIKAGRCTECNKPINADDFKDALSLQECGVSGMCSACQDAVFG